MCPEWGPMQIILPLTIPEYVALHVASSLICTNASSRLRLGGPSGCKNNKHFLYFKIDLTMRNNLCSNSGFGHHMRNASYILWGRGTVPLTINQSTQLGVILHVLIWKMHIEEFQCRMVLSTHPKYFSDSVSLICANLHSGSYMIFGGPFAEDLTEYWLLFYSVLNVLTYPSSTPSSDNNAGSRIYFRII